MPFYSLITEREVAHQRGGATNEEADVKLRLDASIARNRVSHSQQAQGLMQRIDALVDELQEKKHELKETLDQLLADLYAAENEMKQEGVKEEPQKDGASKSASHNKQPKAQAGQE